jgi:MFS family permease
MILGLFAMVVRYLSLYIGDVINQQELYYIGILVHGLIFGFFYVGGQIYIDKKAPEELKAQAQGFIFLMTFGVGLLLGNIIDGGIIEMFKETTEGIRVYDWNSIWGITTLFSVILMLVFVFFFREDKPVLVAEHGIVS